MKQTMTKLFTLQNFKSTSLAMSAVIAALLLSACGSTSPTAKVAPISTPSIVNEPEIIAQSDTPESLINRAQLEWSESRNASARDRLLLQAADAFVLSQQCDDALVIIEHIYPELSNNRDKVLANLLVAECAPSTQIDLTQRAELLVIPATNINYRDRQRIVQAQIFAQQQQWLAAAQALSQLSMINQQDTMQIWGWIQQVDYKQQRESMSRYPNLRQWLALSAMLQSYGTAPQQLANSFSQFVTANPDHPLVQFPPEELLSGIAVTTSAPTKIAVVLPLTGRLAAQGNAIKQGVLSAYYGALDQGSDEQSIQFFDSAATSIDALAIQLEGVDLVIGPLLKNTIEALSPKLSPTTVMVALNRVDPVVVTEPLAVESNEIATQLDSELEAESNNLTAARFYFALAPEDEAHQMAEYIFRQGYRSPILVHAQDAIGQRLAAAFLETWRELNKQQSNDGISIVSYSDNDAMRDGITSALDVAQSKNRIKQLERLLVPELYNVPRNRRDVDAIVAFATPEQTELLNPIVESSLSPFTEKNVPVYVTSRSISLDVTKNQLRDLQNVHFIDLPWMMPNHQWQTISEQVNSLYPNQRDSLKRLFALGYDAYKQVLVLPHLAAIPQLKSQALSGALSVNQAQQVIRSLPMAIIDNEEIKVLVER